MRVQGGVGGLETAGREGFGKPSAASKLQRQRLSLGRGSERGGWRRGWLE